MKIADRLTDALREDAATRQVDVRSMYAATMGRRTTAGPGRRRSHLVVFAVAAVVASVLAGVSFLPRLVDGSLLETPPVATVEGGVDDTFSCAQQSIYDWTKPETVTDDDFLPDLDRGPADAARALDAARYEWVVRGERGVLRLGNTDGTLASITTLARAGDGWELQRAIRCDSDTVMTATAGQWRLGLHGGEPWPGEEMIDPRFIDGEAVLIDDRAFYTEAGTTDHRSIYAAPEGSRLRMVAGTPTGMIIGGNRLRDDTRPVDARSIFVPRDELVGKSSPYGLWQLYTTETVTGMSAHLRDGSVVEAIVFRGAGWKHPVHVVLAPFDDVVELQVQMGEEVDRFAPEELPGYDPRYPN